MSLGKSYKDLEFNFGFSFARLILFQLRHVTYPHYAYLKSKFDRNIETFLFFAYSDTILVGNQMLLIENTEFCIMVIHSCLSLKRQS